MKCTGIDFREFLERFLVRKFSVPYRKFEVEFRDDKETCPKVCGYRVTIKSHEGSKLKYIYSDLSENMNSGGTEIPWNPSFGMHDIVEILPPRAEGNKHVLIRIQERERFSGR